MVLGKNEILKLFELRQIIHPFIPDLLKPASYTLRVGEYYLNTNSERLRIPEQGLLLQPNQFVILESLESIGFPDNILGMLSTRGSMAKKGIDALLSDTVIEPGSRGHLTFCTKITDLHHN